MGGSDYTLTSTEESLVLSCTLVISKYEKDVLLYILKNFLSLTGDKDKDYLNMKHDLEGISGARDEWQEPVADTFHSRILSYYSSHLIRKKESRQVFEHVLSRLLRQKIALQGMLKAVKDIETITNNTKKAEDIISKYYTLESTFQLLDMIKRSTELIATEKEAADVI